MNEEEIIKVLLNHCQECDLREYSTCNECENKFKKAIQGLLDLYNKEKTKNIELKVLIENNLKYSHKLEQDLFENASNYVISKDKIKALKEKVEKEMISNPYDFSYMINELLED